MKDPIVNSSLENETEAVLNQSIQTLSKDFEIKYREQKEGEVLNYQNLKKQERTLKDFKS